MEPRPLHSREGSLQGRCELRHTRSSPAHWFSFNSQTPKKHTNSIHQHAAINAAHCSSPSTHLNLLCPSHETMAYGSELPLMPEAGRFLAASSST